MFHLLMTVDSTNPYRRLAKGFASSDSFPVYRPEGTWRWSAKDSLRVTWTDMFSGVILKMAVRQDTLRGIAKLYTDNMDYPYWDATAPVLGVPVPCPVSP